MTVFDDAMADLFADPNLSRSVQYRIGGIGAGVQIQVIWTQARREQVFGNSGAVIRDTRAAVRLVDIAEPCVNDTLEPLDGPGSLFRISAAPLRSDDNLIADCPLKAV